MMKKLIGAACCAFLLGAASVHAAPALHAFEPDSMARIVAAQKGKPFVLVVWSLECAYCQDSLRTLAQEQRRHSNLRVVTVSTDAFDDTQAVALMKKKLGAAGVTGSAWAFGAASPEQLRYAIDSKWRGEMPRSYWFDARGERTAHSGTITAEMVEKFIAQQDGLRSGGR